MKWIISRYNHDLSYLLDYTQDAIVYDRSDNGSFYDFHDTNIQTIKVPNIGSDLYDKFTFIIDNYDDLPLVAVYTKANIFTYITKGEFDVIKYNNTFTPLMTMQHNTYEPICRYDGDGMYNEINNFWYLNVRPAKHLKEIAEIFHMNGREYNAFAPGSNYILTKENILKHPKEFYEKLRSFLEWDIYPGDAYLLERNLYYLWKP